MPEHFGEVLLRVYTKDVRFVPHLIRRCITNRHSRFLGIVQSGYRALMRRITKSEPTSIDIQSSKSDGIPERPRTPRTASRVSSFNKSFSVGSGDGDENGSPFLNQFTTVGKSYGKSLARPTSPTKLFAPLPASAPVPNLTLEPLELEDHSMEAHPPLQAPISPTAAKRELKTSVAADDVGTDNNTRGTAGGVDSLVTGDRTKVTLPTGNRSPGRGLRSSKRDRGKDTKVKEISGDGSTPKRRRT